MSNKTPSAAATVNKCTIGKQKSCKLTDDSSDDELFSTPPASLSAPPQDEDQVSYKLKQATLCRVQLLSSHCTCSMMTPGLEITMETFHNPPHLV